jgi:hypothetical protein
MAAVIKNRNIADQEFIKRLATGPGWTAAFIATLNEKIGPA